jgi:hypothetical protein
LAFAFQGSFGICTFCVQRNSGVRKISSVQRDDENRYRVYRELCVFCSNNLRVIVPPGACCRSLPLYLPVQNVYNVYLSKRLRISGQAWPIKKMLSLAFIACKSERCGVALYGGVRAQLGVRGHESADVHPQCGNESMKTFACDAVQGLLATHVHAGFCCRS